MSDGASSSLDVQCCPQERRDAGDFWRAEQDHGACPWQSSLVSLVWPMQRSGTYGSMHELAARWLLLSVYAWVVQ